MITYEVRILFRDNEDGTLPISMFDLVMALKKGGLEVEDGNSILVVSKPKPL